MEINSKTFLYAGFFISSNADKDKLNTVLPAYQIKLKNPNWKVYLDHCTMLFNDGHLDDNKSKQILNFLLNTPPNTHVPLIVDGIGRYHDVIAFRVKKTDIISKLVKNRQPHITYMLNPSRNKPVDSNKITDWFDITPIEIDTYIDIKNRRL